MVRKLAGLALITALTGCGAGEGSSTEGGSSGEPSFLYVQNAAGGLIAGNDEFVLSLDQPDDTVIYFSDRPERIAGREDLTKFVDGWSENFGDDPPNAALHFDKTTGEEPDVVATISDPQLKGSELSYSLEPIDEADFSELPIRFENATLFIDSSNGCTPWDPRC